MAAAKAPQVRVLTKADLASPGEMLKQLEAARDLVDFDDEIVVSSTEGFNVEAFVDVVAAYLPQGPRWFPAGMGTDEADEVMVAEFVREKVLRHTREEIPASAPIGRGDAWVAERVAAAKAPQVRVLTKADLASPGEMLKQLEAARDLVDFDDEIVVSSTEGFNVEAFVDVVAAYLPQGPRWFPAGMGTDEADEVMVAEFVREKVLRHTREEIPHAVGVICDEFERPKRDLLRLHATVYVERSAPSATCCACMPPCMLSARVRRASSWVRAAR